jgi:RNA polymerase sigma factor (sigma-70 family)
MLERLWDKNQGILRSIVLSILIDPSGTDDVLQEAYTKVLRSKKHFSTQEEAYNYIRKTVVHTCIDSYRSFKRRTALFVNSRDPDNLPHAYSLADPLTQLMEKEQSEAQETILEEVREMMAELPPVQREALAFAFNGNHQKLREVCREKGIPYSTVRSRVTAGIDRIRRRLKAKGVHQIFREAQ